MARPRSVICTEDNISPGDNTSPSDDTSPDDDTSAARKSVLDATVAVAAFAVGTVAMVLLV